MATPYIGKSVDRLIALANTQNNTSHALPQDFSLGEPRAYSDAQGRNTAVTVTPVNSATYVTQSLRYKRLSLAVLAALAPDAVTPLVVTALPFTIHGSLAQINALLGLNLEPSEVVNHIYTEPQEKCRLEIISENASYAWLKSFYEFSVEFRELDGYRYTTDGLLRYDTNGVARQIYTA